MRTAVALTAGVAGMGLGSLIASSRRADRLAAEQFYVWTGSSEESPEVDGIRSRYSGYVNHLELFGSCHPADLEAVTTILPSEEIHPVRLPDGRAILFVRGMHYREFTMTGVDAALLPYGEVVVAAIVSRAATPPLVPLRRLAACPSHPTGEPGCSTSSCR